MINLPTLEGDEECQKILATFMNDRLIEMMDDFRNCTLILGHLEELPEDKEGRLAQILERMERNPEDLKNDPWFVQKVKEDLLPENFPVQYAGKVFLDLYEILKDPRRRVPELMMEYLLYQLIQRELWLAELEKNRLEDAGDEGVKDEDSFTISRIPEPGRSKVLSSLSECLDEGETLEEKIGWYEDLKNFDMTYFWDEDFLPFAYASEKQLTQLVLREPEYSYEEEE